MFKKLNTLSELVTNYAVGTVLIIVHLARADREAQRLLR